MAAELMVDLVTRLFRDGVESVERITSGRGNRDWYHGWPDRAIAGDASPPFDPSEMDQRNHDAVATIGDISGTGAIAGFAETATASVGRAIDHRNLAYGFPYGTVTVGLHCRGAAEWHLHVWDR